jgi:DNA-binding transcriptional ArsR family regulator
MSEEKSLPGAPGEERLRKFATDYATNAPPVLNGIRIGHRIEAVMEIVRAWLDQGASSESPSGVPSTMSDVERKLEDLEQWLGEIAPEDGPNWYLGRQQDVYATLDAAFALVETLRKVSLTTGDETQKVETREEILEWRRKHEEYSSRWVEECNLTDRLKARIATLEEDLSNVRQCYYEVIEQRNALMKELAQQKGQVK